MNKTLATTLLSAFCTIANASGRLDHPILSCDKAPLLAEFQRQIPDHVLAKASDDQLKSAGSSLSMVAGALFRRAKTDLVCIAVALDPSGKAETAEVSYPAGIKLTPQERQQILEVHWPTVEKKDQRYPTLVSMTFAYQTR